MYFFYVKSSIKWHFQEKNVEVGRRFKKWKKEGLVGVTWEPAVLYNFAILDLQKSIGSMPNALAWQKFY